jgi:hypothetical protein
MNKTKTDCEPRPRIGSRAVSLALAIIVPATSVYSTGGCSRDSNTTELELRTGEILLSNTFEMESSPDAPVLANASAIPVFAQFVPEYTADGVLTSDHHLVLTAEHMTFTSVNGAEIRLRHVTNGLQVVGADQGVGVHWSADFKHLTFMTPVGAYHMTLSGTLAQRRDLTSIFSAVALGGTAPPEESFAIGAALWPIGALLGLAAVCYLVVCTAYAKMCYDAAESGCEATGVHTVHATCGGVSADISEGEEFPSVSFSAGALDCEYTCNPPSGGGEDGGDPPPPPGGNDPWPTPTWDDNPCPAGQEPTYGCVTTTTTTSDTSGDIEEITVTSSSEYGYFCA